MKITVNSTLDEVAGVWFLPVAVSGAPTYKPASYDNPKSYFSEDVVVGVKRLPGIITVPTTGKPPYPAAVLLGGSGPGDMNESIGPNRVFEDLAEGLSSRGIAVLRYDKRTHNPANIDPAAYAHFTVEQEYIEDAVAAVELLRARDDIDHARIFIIGHSLGGLVAPDVAKSARGIAGLVLLAPMGRQFLTAAVDQMRYLGEPPDQIAHIEQIKTGIDSGKLSHSTILNIYGAKVPAGYFTDLNRRDEFKIARQLGIPILVMRGSRDYQVTDADIALWKSALAGDSQASFHEMPTLNHLFIAGSGKPNLAEYFSPGHVDPSVISAIAEFIDAAKPSATTAAAH